LAEIIRDLRSAAEFILSRPRTDKRTLETGPPRAGFLPEREISLDRINGLRLIHLSHEHNWSPI
jgi:hypothetical protein